MSRLSIFDIVNRYSERRAIFSPFFPNELPLDYFDIDIITDLLHFNASPCKRISTLYNPILDLDLIKYTWTTEIKTLQEERKYKWTAEIKNKGSVERKYTFKASSEDSDCETWKKKDKKKCEKVNGKGKKSAVEIEDPSDHGAIVLRKVFAKRRGKQRELSQQDAAALIQITYRSYLIRRSQVLSALRELAVGKNKLQEIRTLFNNFTYHRRLARDAEERQRFSEKIIVLLLTVDAIQGDDLMVRAAKNSMVDELEAMLDVMEPQLCGKPLYMRRRRTFDMPDGVMNKELAEGVAQVVKMLDEEAVDSETFEVCL